VNFRPALPLLALLLAGCEQKMADEPRYRGYDPSPLFDSGASAEPRVEGAVAREDSLAPRPDHIPYPVDAALLARGRERYDIYCSPCHSVAGDGDGIVTRRGFPHPPSFHQASLRAAPDTHFYDVITNGYGAMYPYADRLAPADRWAIVAYIRALQLSRYASAASLPADVRGRLGR
jgi:mono/diheme cytochrome c family protein